MGEEDLICSNRASRDRRDAVDGLRGRAEMGIAQRPCPHGLDLRPARPSDEVGDALTSAGPELGATGNRPIGEPGRSRGHSGRRHGPRPMIRA